MRAVFVGLCVLLHSLIVCDATAAPTYIDVTTLSTPAKGDAVWGVTDCTLTMMNTLVTCPGETFKPPAVGQTIMFIAEDAGGTTSAPVPFVTTIVAGNNHHATLASSPPLSVSGHQHVVSLSVANPGVGYAFSSTQTVPCGAGCPVAATATPVLMKAVLAAMGAGGSGGTNGPCVVTATDQTALGGQASKFAVNVGGSSITSVTSTPMVSGMVTAIAATYSGGTYPEPVSGCGNLMNATINVSYGVVVERMSGPNGIYVAPTNPPCSGTTTTTVGSSDSGGGLTVNCGLAPATVSYGTDNTYAFQSLALGDRSLLPTGTMNYDAATANPTCIYIPGGNYLTQPLNQAAPGSFSNFMAQGYGCWLGDEHYHTNIFIVPNIQGDAFAWIDSNKRNAQPDLGNTQTFSNNTATPSNLNQAGSSFRNITIIGDRLSTKVQNGLMFYGKTEFAYIDNVVVSYLRGRAFGGGYADALPGIGDFNESRVQNAHFDHDGDGQLIPAFEITATGSGPGGMGMGQMVDGSNNLDLVDLRFFQTIGTGMWLHNGVYVMTPARGIRLVNDKFEDSNVEKGSRSGDMLVIGDPGFSIPNHGTNVEDVLCRNLDLVNPPLGYAAIHVMGDLASDTGNIDCDGAISGGSGSGDGVGLQVDTCGQCTFSEASNTTQDYNLQIGPTLSGGLPQTCSGAIIGSPGIDYDGQGAESKLSICIDPSAVGLVSFPKRQVLANGSVLNTYPAGPIDQLVSNISVAGNTTLKFSGAGANVSTNIVFPLWTITRSSPLAPFTDTWDSATGILAAFVNAANGQIYRLRVCNATSFLETLMPGAGVTLAGATTVAGNSCTNFALDIVDAVGGAITITGG